MKIHILLIEDETQIARVLTLELEYEGYHVTVVSNGKEGLDTAIESEFDLILLDVMLPGLNGLEVLRRLRKENIQTPVILLTARNTTFDVVAGLDMGAHDYITKPFEIEELLARIRSCMRHYNKTHLAKEEPVIAIGDLTLNKDTHEVIRNGRLISLTPKEFDLLHYLMIHKNKVITRDAMLSNIWGYDYEGETNVIDVFIRNLRKKVDERFSYPVITTVRGVGYTIKEQSHENLHEN